MNQRLKWLLALLAGVGLAAILFRKPVQEAVLLRSLLSSDSASETAFLALADGAKDRFAFLQRIWNSKKIPHRALVATYLKDNVDTFKGKVVLLNFWTTWCPGCLMEMPDLIELQRKNADRLIILGISLDGQTELDEHGHLAGTHSEGEPGHGQGEGNGEVDLAEVRAKVVQVVKDNGMNYPVLLDPNSEVGRRFNGAELPANVLIDSQGYVRRRFIGGRNVAAFEAMIDELASPKAAR